MDEKVREVEARLKRAEKYAEQMQVEQDCRYLFSHIKELETRIKELKDKLTMKILENAKGAQVLSDAEARIKELEEGIKEHKSYMLDHPADEELYKLIEKEK